MNRLLTGPASEKETRHIEVSLGGSGIQYLPGDSLGVLPENRSDMVQEVLQLLNFRGDEAVKDFYGGALQLREALTSWLVLGKMSHSTVKAWAKHTGNTELKALVLPENKVQLESYLWGREFHDLLRQHPANAGRSSAALQDSSSAGSKAVFDLFEPGASSDDCAHVRRCASELRGIMGG